MINEIFLRERERSRKINLRTASQLLMLFTVLYILILYSNLQRTEDLYTEQNASLRYFTFTILIP